MRNPKTEIAWEVFKYMVLAIMEIGNVDRNTLGTQHLKSWWEKYWELNIYINIVSMERKNCKKINTVLVQTVYYLWLDKGNLQFHQLRPSFSQAMF